MTHLVSALDDDKADTCVFRRVGGQCYRSDLQLTVCNARVHLQ